MTPTLRGAVRSKTVWVNIALAVLSGAELMGSSITTLLGARWAAALVMVGACTNIGLRAYTAQTLAEKGGGS